MLFNTAIVTSVHYFVCLELGSGRYSKLARFITVQLAFDRTTVHVGEFVNRFGHALNNPDNPTFSVKNVFTPLGKRYLFFRYLRKISNFKLNTTLRNLALNLFTFRHNNYFSNAWLCSETYLLRKSHISCNLLEFTYVQLTESYSCWNIYAYCYIRFG